MFSIFPYSGQPYSSIPSAAPSVITGNLAASEANDTASVLGKVLVKGNLAATETGTDTFAASGTTAVVIHGTLAATESGTDTLAASGKVITKGTLAAIESGTDTLAASGKVLIKGSLASTETNDTTAISGKVLVKGSLTATELGIDVFSASGSQTIHGSLAATESGTDTFAASGLVVTEYKWDTSQGKAPSNQFVAMRQTTTHAQKAGLKLRTAKVIVKTTAFVHVHNNLAVKATKVIGGSAKVKSYTGSTIAIPRHRLTGNTEQVIVYKCNTVCVSVAPRAELIYSIPDVVTSSPTVVITQKHSAKLSSYKANVKTVQNPTDDELRAIMVLMRQQKVKQTASFRKMM